MLVTALATYALATAWAVPEPDEPFPAELDLQWTAPAGCPNEDEVRGRIEALLTGPPRGEGVMTVAGTVREDPVGFRLVLATDFDGRTEERELTADACAELGEAAAILLAFALEPEQAESEPEPEQVPEPVVSESTPAAMPDEGPLSPSVVPAEPGTTPPPSEITIPRPTVHLRVGAAAELGALRRLSGGPRLAVGLSWRRARFDLHGGYLAPRRDPSSGPGALYQAGVVGIRGCALPSVSDRITLPVCAGAEGGTIRAATRGFEPARTRHGPWLGPLVSFGLAARFGRVGVWTAAETVVVAYSGEFRLGGDDRFRSLPFSARLVTGIELIVP